MRTSRSKLAAQIWAEPAGVGVEAPARGRNEGMRGGRERGREGGRKEDRER